MKKHSKHLSLVLCIAAAALVSLLLFSCSNGGSGESAESSDKSDKYALAEAVFPEMTPYPSQDEIMQRYGYFNRDAYYAEYEKYREDESRQRNQPALENFDISDFTRECMNMLDTENNSVVSPAGLYIALSALCETVDGEGREELLGKLSPDGSIETLRETAKAVWNASYSTNGVPNSVISSSIWLNDKLSYKKETFDLLAENYYLSSFRGNMSSDKYNAALTDWLNTATGGEMSIADNLLDPENFAQLYVAVQFSANWCFGFDKNETEEGVFHSKAGDTSADFMNKETVDWYYFSDNLEAASLEIPGGEVYFILPTEECDPDSMKEDAAKLVSGDYDVCEYRTVTLHLSIPKFDISSKLDLTDSVKDYVGSGVFDNGADFSPLTDEEFDTAFISKINQTSCLSIDEDRISGAAYIEIGYYGAGIPQEKKVDLIFDRPFYCAVVYNDIPIFLAYVANP